MTTIHAWFSMEAAWRIGSAIYRKPDGTTVNVTRVNADRDGNAPRKHDEKYVGEVVRGDEGGVVRAVRRVAGITG